MYTNDMARKMSAAMEKVKPFSVRVLQEMTPVWPRRW